MTVSVKLGDEVEARLRARLDERTSISDYIRSALIEKMDREDRQLSPYDAWLACFDPSHEAGIGDITSENMEDRYREALLARHRPG